MKPAKSKLKIPLSSVTPSLERDVFPHWWDAITSRQTSDLSEVRLRCVGLESSSISCNSCWESTQIDQKNLCTNYETQLRHATKVIIINPPTCRALLAWPLHLDKKSTNSLSAPVRSLSCCRARSANCKWAHPLSFLERLQTNLQNQCKINVH